METISLLMILPYAGNKAKKGFIIGIAAAGLMFAISIFFTIGILGVYRSAHLTYPIYVIFREMQLSKFIQHVEAVLSINMLLLVFLKLSILFYCAVLGICQLFQIKNRTCIAYPTIWLISAYSLLFKNITENVEWVQNYLFPYYTLYGVILPAVLVGVNWIRAARERQTGEIMRG
ncbi:GerAB/ArcD/ProY family transporter [Paenibacillus sp. R14(2021)]|uniref:GerAB/ArcD/ProY family transporter n=1 Tax=Paenibacillus sp. R14(2021) TaxID=2859228 RepID=UPI001C6148C9|nr:GerAB/ArcD/ProY family transporter [Paenibacillus sp. R14(2021)]